LGLYGILSTVGNTIIGILHNMYLVLCGICLQISNILSSVLNSIMATLHNVYIGLLNTIVNSWNKLVNLF
jgi:hypothetical protein